MIKLKCKKCGLCFKERENYGEKPESEYLKRLCYNCKFICETIGLVIKSFEDNPFMVRPLNRDVKLDLDNLIITKKRK